jgi:hypothetical protein
VKHHMECPICGEEVEVLLDAGERTVLYYSDGSGYPGSPPSAEVVGGCDCYDNLMSTDQAEYEADLLRQAQDRDEAAREAWDDARFEAWRDR